MTRATRRTVIGLTGPFGSGCSTTARILKEHLGYELVSLSSLIVEDWKRKNAKDPSRSDLQRLGNELRKASNDPGAIVRRAAEQLEATNPPNPLVVFDGIRNVGEIQTLRELYGNSFFLLAIECPASERFGRLSGVYGKGNEGLAAFTRDNENDRDQENPFGQQVQLCVDLSDVMVVNDNEVTLTELRQKVTDLIGVVTGDKPRYPNADEVLMNFAYSAAHASKCLKRQVGAVVVEAGHGSIGRVLGNGFNENPQPTLPCVEEPKYGASSEAPGRCFRDIVRQKSFQGLAQEKALCPKCGEQIREPSEEPPWNCSKCQTSLELFFWPERAMTLCTAVHAEVAALYTAGTCARGATLYTTTYPCFQCAEKIIQAGIRDVVFNEPYPDIRAAERFEIAKIETRRFEGVRSARFDEIFSRARPYIAAQRKASLSQSKV